MGESESKADDEAVGRRGDEDNEVVGGGATMVGVGTRAEAESERSW